MKEKALTLVDHAKAVRIVDSATYTNAGLLLKDIAAMRRQIQEHHAPMKQAAHETHAKICAAERALLEPVATAEGLIKREIGTYDLAQRRIQQEAERKAREEAERAALEAREAIIEDAEAAGASVEEIQTIIETPVITPAVNLQRPEQAKVQGVSTITSYRAVVFDVRKLARAVADGVVPTTLITANESGLNAMARALKGAMQIPGVRVDEIAQVRAGRK